MAGAHSIGVDVGTSTICAVAWDTAVRRVVGAVTLPNRDAASADQDPRMLLRTVRQALAGLSETVRGGAGAIACTGQMHGAILVDERLEPLTPLVTWQDQRTAPLAAALETELERSVPGGWRGRGCHLHAGYGAVTLADMVRRGLPEGTRWACTAADWVAAGLCGHLATDPSQAASWGVYSLGQGGWDTGALRVLGIPEDLLPPLRDPGTPLGMADLGPLGPKVPLVCGLGDNQASVHGAVVGRANARCVVNVGTGSQLSVILPAAVRPPLEGLEARPYLEGAHLLVGASLNGGSAYAALRDLFRSAGVERGDLYAAMDGWARAVPKGCDGLVCEAGFWGERGRPDLTGTFRGLSPRTFTPGHLARAILEGMARNLHEIWIRAGSPSGDIVGSGNALRNNPLLREILTECIGADVDLADHREEAAVGAALLAARLIEGAGPFISPQTAFGLQTA